MFMKSWINSDDHRVKFLREIGFALVIVFSNSDVWTQMFGKGMLIKP
jgi:uncharacterized protein YkwD